MGQQPIQSPRPEPQGKSLPLDPEHTIRVLLANDLDAAITLLFRLYYGALCSHALRFVSSKAIAEDIVSDIFYEFQTEQHFLKVKTSFRAYLFAAVRHRAFDYVRRELNRQVSLDCASAVPINEVQNPDEITQYEELYQDVQQAISDMPLKRRQVYLLNRLEGKKAIEIADELSLSVRTVETHIFQAILQLRNQLSKKWH